MSTETRRAGADLLRALGRHAELIMEAYASTSGGIQETEGNTKAIAELCRHRLFQRDDRDDLIRLRTPLRNLLSQGLSSVRLQMVNANIGQSVEGIRVIAEQYRASKRDEDLPSCEALLQSLRDNVFSLCDDLADQSRDIWQQISSDFGIAARLSSKIALNAAAISRVKQTQEALKLVDMDGLYQICRRDRDLMGVVFSRLRLARENCLKELGDAIARLNSMMFNLKRLERRARQVARLSTHFRNYPDFRPSDYSEMADVPGVFLHPEPRKPGLNMDAKSESLELEQAQMIIGLRKEEVIEEVVEPTQRMTAKMTQEAPEDIEDPEFKKAIRALFCDCIDKRQRVSAMDHFDPEIAGDDPGLWLFAVLSEYASIEGQIKHAVALDYVGEISPQFNGNFIAEDLILCPL